MEEFLNIEYFKVTLQPVAKNALHYLRIEKYILQKMKEDEWKNLEVVEDLEDLISECKNEEEREEAILGLFIPELSIKFSFAEKLHIYDLFRPQCLQSKHGDGQSLIAFMAMLNLAFIIVGREWEAENRLTFDIDICEGDYAFDMQQEYLRKGEKVIKFNQPN